jgi:hypothetical protein
MNLFDAVRLALDEEFQHHTPEIGSVHEAPIVVVDGDERGLSLQLLEQMLGLADPRQAELAGLVEHLEDDGRVDSA